MMQLGHLIHLLLPAMREQGWGHIVNVAAAEAMTPPPAVPLAVSSADAPMVNMSLGLSKALGSTGITVNCISPGLLDIADRAEIGGDSGQASPPAATSDEARARQSKSPPGDPRSVASLVAWLCSPLAAYGPGANIRFDGGYSAAVH